MQNCTVLALSAGLLAVALPATAANVDVSNCTANKAWLDAYNKGDAAAIAAMYTPDAIEVITTGIRVGPALVKERIEADLKQGVKYKDTTATKCDVDGDIRISAGDWNAESEQGPFGGFWTAVERKDGGSWKIINLTGNITLPPPPTK